MKKEFLFFCFLVYCSFLNTVLYADSSKILIRLDITEIKEIPEEGSEVIKKIQKEIDDLQKDINDIEEDIKKGNQKDFVKHHRQSKRICTWTCKTL